MSLPWVKLWADRLKSSPKWRALGNDAVAKGTYLELLMAADRSPRSPHCGMVYRSLDDTGPVPFQSIRALAADLGIHHRTLPAALETLKRVRLLVLRGGIPELTGFRKLVKVDHDVVKVAGKVDHKVDQRNTGIPDKSFPVEIEIEIPTGGTDVPAPPRKANPNPTLAAFEAVYAEVHGRSYVFGNYGAAGKLLGGLREKIGATAAEAWSGFVRRYLEDRDPKLLAEGHPHSWLPSRANRYLAALARTPKPRRTRTAADLEAGERAAREYQERLKAERVG